MAVSARDTLAFNGLLFALPVSLAFRASKSPEVAVRVMGDGAITPLSTSALRVLASVYLQLGLLVTFLAYKLPLQATAVVLRAVSYLRVLTLIGDAHTIAKSAKVSRIAAALNAALIVLNEIALRT